MKSAMKKMIAVLLAMAMCLSGSNYVLAGNTSGSGLTSGGSSGTIRVNYRFMCNANYTNTADAAVIDMTVASGNVLWMGYEEVRSTKKTGNVYLTSVSGLTSTAVNSKTWVLGSGNAGTMSSSNVKHIYAYSSAFGRIDKYDLAANY